MFNYDYIFLPGDTHGAEDPKTGLPMAKQAWHVNHIRFSYKHMKILGDIPAFSRIVILILDNNYLENIDDLISCRELIKLDIHSNQVTLYKIKCWLSYQVNYYKNTCYRNFRCNGAE